ncbi:MAG: nucleotide 5'-monophosphate nucleosidase PpnN [Pseudomonadales bacterium]
MMEKVNVKISPRGQLEVLSQREVSSLLDSSQTGLYSLYRNCSLAVLNSGADVDDTRSLLDAYADFEIKLLQEDRGIRLELKQAPPTAFVNGMMLAGIREHLFSVLRDILYVNTHMQTERPTGDGFTHGVFDILRNAGVLKSDAPPKMVVCWGGHTISRPEYQYTKDVGYQLGLRGLDICTGCGDGAMKGPMKGAAIGHAKQRIKTGRYLGISEPGIIGAEPPNPIVNELVIMPDIEMRLEAFVRLGHAFVVFPGGAGTAEEIFYLIGLLLSEENRNIPFPLIFTGPESARSYFEEIDRLLVSLLGESVRDRYTIIIDDPEAAADAVFTGIRTVRKFRKARSDAYYFNWSIQVPAALQSRFVPTHESMSGLNLHLDQPAVDLCYEIRRAFSGIVAGTIKEQGQQEVARLGPFQISGDRRVVDQLGDLLDQFVLQKRLKVASQNHRPCYEVRA